MSYFVKTTLIYAIITIYIVLKTNFGDVLEHQELQIF